MAEKLSSGPKASHDLTRTGSGLSRGPNLRKKAVAAPWSSTFPAPQASLDLDFANDRGFVRGVGQGRSMDAVTFTRASAGQYIDSTGTLQSATNNVPRFDWASTAQRPQNLLRYTEEFDNAYWSQTNISSVSANVVATTDPLGGNTADKIIENTASGLHSLSVNLGLSSGIYTFSVYAKAAERSWIRLTNNTATGTNGSAYFNLSNGTIGSSGGGTAAISDAGNGWYRCSVSGTLTSSNTIGILLATGNDGQGYTGDGTSGVYVWGAQSESGSSATTYIANGAYSATNTPLAANPTCNGLLIEESRANRLLWCRDATNAAWVKTDVTAAKDQTGIDGVANAASSLTASADNGTCIQTITLASGSRTGSVYLKRITGTGNVQVTLDGSTWSTVDLSSTEWRRIVLSGTVTNPTVGIRLATNGDAVAIDYGQIEDALAASSPILTTSASVTRSADVASMSGVIFNNWYDNYKGTFVFDLYGGNTGGSWAGAAPYDTFIGAVGAGRQDLQFSLQGSGNIPQILNKSGQPSTGLVGNLSIANYAFGGSWIGFKAVITRDINNNCAISLNGTSTLQYNFATLPSTATLSNQLYINGRLCPWVKQITFYPKRLSNEAVQILSRQTP